MGGYSLVDLMMILLNAGSESYLNLGLMIVFDMLLPLYRPLTKYRELHPNGHGRITLQQSK